MGAPHVFRTVEMGPDLALELLGKAAAAAVGSDECPLRSHVDYAVELITSRPCTTADELQAALRLNAFWTTCGLAFLEYGRAVLTAVVRPADRLDAMMLMLGRPGDVGRYGQCRNRGYDVSVRVSSMYLASLNARDAVLKRNILTNMAQLCNCARLQTPFRQAMEVDFMTNDAVTAHCPKSGGVRFAVDGDGYNGLERCSGSYHGTFVESVVDEPWYNQDGCIKTTTHFKCGCSNYVCTRPPAKFSDGLGGAGAVLSANRLT